MTDKPSYEIHKRQLLDAFAATRSQEYVERHRRFVEAELKYADSLFEFLLTDEEAREWLAAGRWLPQVLETLTYRPTEVYVDSYEEGKRLACEAAARFQRERDRGCG